MSDRSDMLGRLGGPDSVDTDLESHVIDLERQIGLVLRERDEAREEACRLRALVRETFDFLTDEYAARLPPGDWIPWNENRNLPDPEGREVAWFDYCGRPTWASAGKT